MYFVLILYDRPTQEVKNNFFFQILFFQILPQNVLKSVLICIQS